MEFTTNKYDDPSTKKGYIRISAAELKIIEDIIYDLGNDTTQYSSAIAAKIDLLSLYFDKLKDIQEERNEDLEVIFNNLVMLQESIHSVDFKGTFYETDGSVISNDDVVDIITKDMETLEAGIYEDK